MSVHVSGDGINMPLRLVRRFVEATAKYPEDTVIHAGIVGLRGTQISYTTLHGLQTAEPVEDDGEKT